MLIRRPGEILLERGNSKHKREQQKKQQRFRAEKLSAAKTDEQRRSIKQKWRKWDENIGLLKPLLLDNWARVLPSGNDPNVGKRVWRIRKAAYETLTEWGVKVKKPHLEEPSPRK